MQASSSRYQSNNRPPVAETYSDSGSESDYSSSEVEEDEDGDELTPALDAAILRTLSKIKSKQGVYGGEKVLEEELKHAQQNAERKGLKSNVVRRTEEKPYRLTDYHRAKLLSGRGMDDEDAEPESGPLTHVQSERLMRQEAVSAFKYLAADDDEEEEEGLELQKREKDEDEAEGDEEEYRKFLLEMGGGEDAVRKILGMGDQPISRALEDTEDSDGVDDKAKEENEKLSKAEKKEKKKLEKKKKEQKSKDDEDFLMNYILNRGWIDKSEKHVPTYDEITAPTKVRDHDMDPVAKETGSSSHPWGELEDEDDFDERAEQFETEYNFRFEEPGASTIVTHPRDIPSLVRRPDDARKLKRAARAERKAAERAAQEEETRRLKGQKRREMERSMASLKADLAREGVQGSVDWERLEKVLDGEWNEDEWEKVVGGMLSGVNEPEEEDESGKPVWDDDLGDAEYDDAEDGQDDMGMDVDANGHGDEAYGNEYADDAYDAPINMDADFEDGDEPSKKKRKKNKKGKDKEREEVVAEVEDIEEGEGEDGARLSVIEKATKVKKAMEAYKSLDHEDLIDGGEIATKFKYTQSQPTSYGLTPVEILLATDEELNKVLGIKSLAAYRKGGIGLAGKGLNKRVRELKDEISKRKWGQGEQKNDNDRERQRDSGYSQRNGDGNGNANGDGKRPGKRMGKKERQKLAKAAESTA